MVRAIVCGNFIKKGLEISGKVKYLNRFYILYYGIIGLCVLTTFIIAVIPAT